MRRLHHSVASAGGVRCMTAKGQFNPLHTFESSIQRNEVARTAEEFKHLITNPGPLRVAYSADYVDWYFRAYREKCEFVDKKRKAQQKVAISPAAVGAPELGVYPGLIVRPSSSTRRTQAEQRKAAAIKLIEDATVEHGTLDCFERQPHFPVIHIDRCTDFHIRDLVQELIVDHAFSSDAVWEKALAYRALLKHQMKSYPQSFQYIFPFVDAVAVSSKIEDPQDPRHGQWDNADRYPTTDACRYFEQAIQRYHIENAVDVHVFLSCHAQPTADALLFTEPPPKDLKETLVDRPTTYPSLKVLLEDDSNVALLRVLLFADLNCFVSVDPFIKFPGASAAIVPPKFEHASQNLSQGSLAEIVEQRRHNRAAPLSQAVRNAIEGRGNDIARLQRNHTKSELQFSQRELNKAADANPSGYAMNGASYLNPKTVRAEIRDDTTRRLLGGMKAYETSRKGIYRESFDELRAAAAVHATEENQFPRNSPTIPKFLSMILNDSVVNFLMAVSDESFQAALTQHSRFLARQYMNLAMEFHVENLRRVNHQKVLVAAAVLDELIDTRAKSILDGSDKDLSDALRRTGTYVPFAQRGLDALGFPSGARFDDYTRWMRPPSA
jgi:hypothetical protein